MVLGNATLTLNECKCNYIHATGDGAGTANKVEIFVNGGALPKVTPNIFITAILPMVLPNDILMQRFISVAMFRSHS